MDIIGGIFELLDKAGISRGIHNSLSKDQQTALAELACDVYYGGKSFNADEVSKIVLGKKKSTEPLIGDMPLIEEHRGAGLLTEKQIPSGAEELRKYERFVEDTDLFLKNSGEQEMHGILSLIFDYEKCNDYARVIMENSTFPMRPSDDGLKDLGKNAFLGGNGFTDDEEKLRAVRQFAQSCIQSGHDETGCRLIFWALMVLTVDESDAEKHLDLICNLAEMLCITDDEFEDIVQLVKAAYSEATPEYEFKSEKIPAFFPRFIEACGWKVDETAA